MKITINRADFESILEHARVNIPEEACGLIAGEDTEDGTRVIKKVYLLTNIDHTNEHFTIDPKDQLASGQLALSPRVTVPPFGGG